MSELTQTPNTIDISDYNDLITEFKEVPIRELFEQIRRRPKPYIRARFNDQIWRIFNISKMSCYSLYKVAYEHKNSLLLQIYYNLNDSLTIVTTKGDRNEQNKNENF